MLEIIYDKAFDKCFTFSSKQNAPISLAAPLVTTSFDSAAPLVPLSLSALPLPAVDPIPEATEAQMREQLLIKKKQLLDLQQKKLELELLQTQNQLEEQARKNKLQEEFMKQQQVT